MKQQIQVRLRTMPRVVTVCLAAMLTVLAACGGADQTAGIEGSGSPVASNVTTTGRITGFGSIFVDGVEYSTATAQIRIDGQPATEADLRVGHVVTVTGTVNQDGTTGTATEVTMTSDVRGDVGSVDVAANTFLVLGQTVEVTADTLFDDSTQATDLAALKPGTKVRVSGFVTAAGEILASRIDGVSDAASQVSGKVKSLDSVAKSFQMNNLLVDYRSANVSGSLAEGSKATVQGTISADGSTLVATVVTVSAQPPGNAGENGQVQGLITTFNSSASFVVDGQAVSTDASTKFNLHGLTLGTDVFVNVHGKFDSSHVLVADQVEAKPSAASLARGTVDAISVAGGTLSVLGVNVQVSPTTTFEDHSAGQKRQFGLKDVNVGDYVEVRGLAVDGAPMIASAVQRSKGDNRSYVQGIAQALAPPSFKVLGVTVTADAKTSFTGLGAGNPGADAFFQQAANRIVNVRGTMNGNTLVADQVRIMGQ